MSISTSTLRNQLRTLLTLTNTEVQVAETRIAQARTDAVRKELSENAANGRIRAVAIEKAIRDLGGLPDVLRPVLGRLAATVKALAEQAQPFDEALLGDLALEHQLLDRSIYVKALATAESEPEVVALAERLITAHQATVDWLTIVLAEEAIGGPVALRRGPLQAASGAALRVAGIPATLTARGVDRAVDVLRSAPARLGGFVDKTEEAGGAAVALATDARDKAVKRVTDAGETVVERASDAGKAASKTVKATRDAALDAAEDTARAQGATGAADAIHAVRDATGLVDPEDLPIVDYDSLNVNSVVSAVKQLDEPSDIRTVIAYEEAHKGRHGVISAAQTRLAAIAEEIVGVK
ncbi:ferritin-like domain-containing protein [Williamsia soli]|uniref:ferritin-like domain-containing protein n=1 Tax=Williamsia soli TaxID=364929 RepID=UPI001A9EAE4C|nr:ferritin-like domain-containing protein [Williamsia soli]